MNLLLKPSIGATGSSSPLLARSSNNTTMYRDDWGEGQGLFITENTKHEFACDCFSLYLFLANDFIHSRSFFFPYRSCNYSFFLISRVLHDLYKVISTGLLNILREMSADFIDFSFHFSAMKQVKDVHSLRLQWKCSCHGNATTTTTRLSPLNRASSHLGSKTKSTQAITRPLTRSWVRVT